MMTYYKIRLYISCLYQYEKYWLYSQMTLEELEEKFDEKKAMRAKRRALKK